MKIARRLALVVIVLCVCLGALPLGWIKDAWQKAVERLRYVRHEDIAPWERAVEEQLKRWGVQVETLRAASGDGATQSNAVNEFLKIVAQQEGWRLDGPNPHVDVEFLRRLPVSPNLVKGNPKEPEVRKAMLQVLKSLSGENRTMEEEPAEAIVSKIVKHMDYRVWYASERRNKRFDGRSKPLEDKERDYLRRFCLPSSGISDGGLTQQLYEIMVSRWGVQGLIYHDVNERPWFVVGCFFEFITATAASEPVDAASRPAAGGGGSTSRAPVPEPLAKYLPAESVVARAALGKDNMELVIRDGLLELAGKFDLPTKGEDNRTLLDKVTRRLEEVAKATIEKLEKDNVRNIPHYLKRLTGGARSAGAQTPRS